MAKLKELLADGPVAKAVALAPQVASEDGANIVADGVLRMIGCGLASLHPGSTLPEEAAHASWIEFTARLAGHSAATQNAPLRALAGDVSHWQKKSTDRAFANSR